VVLSMPAGRPQALRGPHTHPRPAALDILPAFRGDRIELSSAGYGAGDVGLRTVTLFPQKSSDSWSESGKGRQKLWRNCA
jgi:hypothetical protein